MKRTIELPRQSRAAEVRAASFDEADNSIEVCFTTGATVRRATWRDGVFDEELIVTPEAVRLDRLNAGAPFLNTHADWSLEDVIGSVAQGTARIEGGKGYARIRLSGAECDKDNVEKIRSGIIRNVSVGYQLHRVEKIEGAEGTVPLWRVVDWEPFEISAVPIPADPGAQARANTAARGFSCELTDTTPSAAVLRARMNIRRARLGLNI